jgi:hypothetical protein
MRAEIFVNVLRTAHKNVEAPTGFFQLQCRKLFDEMVLV